MTLVTADAFMGYVVEAIDADHRKYRQRVMNARRFTR